MNRRSDFRAAATAPSRCALASAEFKKKALPTFLAFSPVTTGGFPAAGASPRLAFLPVHFRRRGREAAGAAGADFGLRVSLPGAILASINGVSTDGYSHKQVVDLIKSSGNYLRWASLPAARLAPRSLAEPRKLLALPCCAGCCRGRTRRGFGCAELPERAGEAESCSGTVPQCPPPLLLLLTLPGVCSSCTSPWRRLWREGWPELSLRVTAAWGPAALSRAVLAALVPLSPSVPTLPVLPRLETVNGAMFLRRMELEARLQLLKVTPS